MNLSPLKEAALEEYFSQPVKVWIHLVTASLVIVIHYRDPLMLVS